MSCVREGETVLVMDRNTPVACLSPYRTDLDAVPERIRAMQTQGLLSHTPEEASRTLPKPLKLKVPVDVGGYLLEERESGR